MRIEAAEVKGRLWGGLELADVRVTWPEGRAVIGAVRLRWNPMPLLQGRISLGELGATGIRIQDDRPRVREPLDLTWPEPGGLLAALDVHAELELEGLTYRRRGEPPTALQSAEARVDWRSGTLSLRDLAARTSSGALRGSLRAGFRKP
ncbi:MAG: hypothetical protein HY900_26975, partial [Deltaproteobacteria bacterium]|nr:hypothetical protein [Deltaproteobacteria bacterium]